MRRATHHRREGDWPHGSAGQSVTLDFDARHRRRIRLELDDGEPVLLDLERAVAMREGDGLKLEDGGWIRVRAAAEPVLEITVADPVHAVRVAWHLGNRHVPTEIGQGTLVIRPDHVLADMVVRLGATVRAVERPFQPEGGAYGDHDHHHGGHGHDGHGHDEHGHDGHGHDEHGP